MTKQSKNNSDAIQSIIDGLVASYKKVVEDARYDRTSVGRIKSKTDNGYIVSAFGGEYEVKTNEIYSVGNSVAVIAPQNNFKKLYIKPYEINQSVEQIKQINENLNSYVDETNKNISDLQTQLDGKTEQYFYNYSPSTSNIPANEWISEAQKADHNGDVFYNTSNGDVYQWLKVNEIWGWVKSGDSGLKSALDAAAQAQATADGKRRVFIKTPVPPYEIGDLWCNGTDILACITNRKVSDEYDVNSDFGKQNAYVDKSKSVNVVDVLYALSTSPTDAPASGWQTVAPKWTDGKYMWQKTVITYADKHTSESAPTCISGAIGQSGGNGSDGVGIYKIVEYYYKSTSPTALSGDSWSEISPTWEDGKYIWTKSVITYTDNNTSETKPICSTGFQGENGVDATAITCGNEAQILASDNNGFISGAQTIIIPFSGYVGDKKVVCTVTYDNLPDGIILESNTASTESSDGSLIFTVEKGSNLGNNANLVGAIDLIFSCNNKTFKKTFTWTKGIKGDNGTSGEDAILLRIESSRGTVFKNNSISTVLSAVIYKGSQRITDIDTLHKTLGNDFYIQWYWQKLDENTFGVVSSSDAMVGNNGFTLTVSPSEVDAKVTFMCELKN